MNKRIILKCDEATSSGIITNEKIMKNILADHHVEYACDVIIPVPISNSSKQIDIVIIKVPHPDVNILVVDINLLEKKKYIKKFINSSLNL